MPEGVLIVDALASGSGRRTSSRDSIGCGPRCLAGIFEKHQIRNRITRAEDVIHFKKKFRDFKHLAISAMTMDFTATQQIINIWNRGQSGGKVIVGGPIASDPVGVLSELKSDVVVIGEGEATVDELLKTGFLESNTELDEIRGIGYLNEGIPFLTDTRPYISAKELSESYSPSTVRIVDYSAYQASKVYVEVVRGCSNFQRTRLRLPDGRECTECSNCEAEDTYTRMECPEGIPPGCGFCSVPAIWGPPRSRNCKSIVSEVQELLELGVHRIILEAPDFLDYMRGSEPVTSPCSPAANLKAISELLEQLCSLQQIQEGLVHLGIENVKACLFTEEVAATLSDSVPAISPNIGLETGSETHMKTIGKCGTPSDVVRAVEIAVKYRMTPFVYFIYGLPGEDASTVKDSLRIMRELSRKGAERIILYGFRPLPGSSFADYNAPSLDDPISQELRNEAKRINRGKKERYIGKVVKGIAAEPSWEKHGYTMIYPFREGPIMTVRGGFSPGTILNLKITHVLSPGLVEAVVTKNEKL